MSDGIFNTYGRYYDLLYRDKDYSSETTYIKNLLVRFGIADGDLLEFGSGTGKHGRLLAKQGYNVHGIERSAEMVAESKLSQGFSCQQGDITEVVMGRAYDAVLSLFHVLSYQNSNEQVLAVFTNAAAHCKLGGLFIFDFWYTPAVYTEGPSVRIKRVSDEKMEVTRLAEPVIYSNENRVDVNYTLFARDLSSGLIQTTKEVHSMRHFSLPEIDILATVSGFERIHAEAFLVGGAPSEETWGVCVTLKKVRL